MSRKKLIDPIKERNHRIGAKLASRFNLGQAPYFNVEFAKGSEYLEIKPREINKYGIKLSEFLSFTFIETWQRIDKSYTLKFYSYKIYILSSRLLTPRCLFRYDYNPDSEYDYHHLHVLQEEPFHDKVHFPTWLDFNSYYGTYNQNSSGTIIDPGEFVLNSLIDFLLPQVSSKLI